jgi:phenylalanyl-tRNA synthetase beta chain
MKISYKWLKNYLKSSLDIKKISEVLTDIGLEVERIEENEENIEIEFPPNRFYAMSHYGLARDLYVALTFRGFPVKLIKPPIIDWKMDLEKYDFSVLQEEERKCLRYSGMVFSGVKVTSSPKWMQNYLKSIGSIPINNIIDITNFVMHEIGQPIQALDVDRIKSRKIRIKTPKKNVLFETCIDGSIKKLDTDDLVIFDGQTPICIAGILESPHYSVGPRSKNIFIESAYFDPISIRKSAKKHGLKTEYSFRFERGVDPDNTVYALFRAALMIQEFGKGKISSEIIDIYPDIIPNFEVIFRPKKINPIIGCKIYEKETKKILKLLEIQILSEGENLWKLSVPPNRAYLRREEDLIEEILRIYGYNRITNSVKKNLSIKDISLIDIERNIEGNVSKLLIYHGFYESINLSFSKNETSKFMEKNNKSAIKIANPWHKDISIMRFSLLFGLLENVANNIRRKNINLKFFEWGQIYCKEKNKYLEEPRLGLLFAGRNIDYSFYMMKGIVEQILKMGGLYKNLTQIIISDHLFFEKCVLIKKQELPIVEIGKVNKHLLKKLNIHLKVFYSEFFCQNFMLLLKKRRVFFKEPTKYPLAKRDLSFFIENRISFEEVIQVVRSEEKNLIKKIELFDVYTGEQVPKGKKSYAFRFYLGDERKTLRNNVINETMEKLQEKLIKKLGAEFREITMNTV